MRAKQAKAAEKLAAQQAAQTVKGGQIIKPPKI
jgi:hypothetical protein